MNEIKVNFKAAALYLNVITQTVENILDELSIHYEINMQHPDDEQLNKMIKAICLRFYFIVKPSLEFLENTKPCPLNYEEQKLLKWMKNKAAEAQMEMDLLPEEHTDNLIKDFFSFMDETMNNKNSIETNNEIGTLTDI